MTRLDIHPEHLIDRVLRGTASEAERSELSAHMRVCSACGLERELALSLREPLAGELESTAVAVDAALAALVGAGRLLPAPALAAPNVQRHAPSRSRAWLPWAMAACLFFTGSAAAATLIMAVRGTNPPADTGEDSVAAKAQRKRAGAKRAPVAASEPATDAVPAPAVQASEVQPQAQPSAPSATQVRVRRAPVVAHALGAAELFAEARATAMRGEFSQAAALYTAVQKRFASSPQAHVSRVVLGRLYLEHVTDPRAALLQFDAYLAQGGPNRPEALLGRARALRALGRVHDEVQALRTLVDAYPESLYVAPAEERLRAVE